MYKMTIFRTLSHAASAISCETKSESETEPETERKILTVVTVFLVSRFGLNVRLDAVFAEGVQTFEAFRILVGIETDLADEKLVVDLLRQRRLALEGRKSLTGRVVWGRRRWRRGQ